MEAARVPRLHLDGRQAALVAALVVLAIFAWLVTDDRMAGMDAGPGTDPGALGFYVGVWVVMMAALIALEKLLPWKAVANRGVALLLATLGVAVALTPGSVPGLTLPDSAQA